MVNDNFITLEIITGLFHDDIKGNTYVGLPSGIYVPINIKDREDEDYGLDSKRPFYAPVGKIESIKEEMAKVNSDSVTIEILDDSGLPEESIAIPNIDTLEKVLVGGSVQEEELEEQEEEVEEAVGVVAGTKTQEKQEEEVELQEEEVEEAFAELEGDVEFEEYDPLDDFDLEFEEILEEVKHVGILKVYNAYDITRVKDLIADDEVALPELLELKRSNLMNLVNISNAGLTLSKGQRLLEHEGLPSWIVPVVAVTQNKVGKFTDDIETPLYEMQVRDGCTLETELNSPFVHVMHKMDTDPIDQPAGGWTRERQDHTLNVVHHLNGSRPLKDALQSKVKKLKGNQYDMHIQLKDFARSKLQRAKKDKNMYGRLLGMPNQIEGISTKQIYSNHMHVVGFIIRPVGTPLGKPLSGNERIIPLKCEGVSNTRDHVAEVLDSMFRTIPDIIREHSDIVERCYNLIPFSKVLAHYKYTINDLTVDDMDLLRSYLRRNNEEHTNTRTRWARIHADKIKSIDKRTPGEITFNPLNQLDSGRSYYCSELTQYLERVGKESGDIIRMADSQNDIPNVSFPAGTDDIYITSNDVYYKYGNKWYIKDNYTKVTLKYARNMYNTMVDEHPVLSAVQEECKKLDYSLQTIKNYHHARLMRSVMSRLEDSRKQKHVRISPEVNLLLSFDLTTRSGEKLFKEYLDSYIRNEIAADIHGFYRMKSTGEIICCKHVYRQVHNQEFDGLTSSDGRCIYCGVTIVTQIQKDDFNQMQQTTMRDMYMSEDIEEVNDPNRMLEIFTNVTLRGLNDIIQYKLTPENIEDITTAVITYITENHPELVDPYRTNDLPAQPIGSTTTDLLTGLLYSMPASAKENSTNLFNTVTKAKGKALVLNKSIMSQVYSYVQEMTGFNLATYEVDSKPYYIHLQKLASKSKKILAQVNSRSNIYAMGMLKPFSKIFGIILAHLINKVNEDYNTTSKADILKTVVGTYNGGDSYLINLMNDYHRVINEYIGTAISYLKVASVENRELVRENYERMTHLFEGNFNKSLIDAKLLGDIDVWAQTNQYVESVYTKITYGLKIYQEEAEKEIKEDGLSLAKFERDYNGLQINISQSTGYTSATTHDEHQKCIAEMLHRSGEYGRRLWQHYVNIIGTDLDQLIIQPTWETEEDTIKISDLFEMERKGTNITDVRMSKGQTCMYDAMAYSTKLYVQPGLEELKSTAVQHYLQNEQTLQDYVDSKSDLETVMAVYNDDVGCDMLWSDLQSHKNLGFKPADDFRSNVEVVPVIDDFETVGVTFEKGSELISKSFTRPMDADFLKRLHVLVKYMKDDKYIHALDGVFEKHKNILTAYITDGAADTINLSPAHQKAQDRAGVTYYQSDDFMPIDMNDDFLVSMMGGDTWPVPTKTPDNKVNLVRRKLKRKQQLGPMMKKYFHWIAQPITGDVDEWSTMMDGIVETEIGSNTYTIEKEILDMDGYFLEGLFNIKKSGVQAHKLSSFQHYLPELYSMSYSEFKLYVEDNQDSLVGDDESKLLVFDRNIYSDMITAVIRLDLLMHYRFVIQSDTEYDVRTIHKLASGLNVDDKGTPYGEFLNDFFTAINTVDVLDPVRSEIDKIYEVRFLDDIKRRFINKGHMKAMGLNVAGAGLSTGEGEEEDNALELTEEEEIEGAQGGKIELLETEQLELLEDDGNLELE